MRLLTARSVVVTASALALAVAGLVTVPAVASASPASDVRITEFAYGGLIAGSTTGGDGEYVEITNLGSTSVDMSGWTYGTAAAPGTVPLSGFGTLAPGESAIVTDVAAAEFRTDWGLTDAVKVVNDGDTTLNKGPKTMSLYDPSNATVDSVSYASGFLSGKGISAWVDAAHVGAMSDTTGWTVSTVGDQEDSWTSATGSVGSPGISSLASESRAAPSVAITEFAYGGQISSSTGGDGEYVEVTDIGRTPVDMSGWTYGTDDTAPGAVSLSGFDTLAPGESAIITDVTPAEFRTDWGLTDAVKVVNDGDTTLNKGPKTMYLFDAGGNTIDSVSYASGFLSGGKGQSAWVDASHVGAKSDTTGWTFSTVGDQEDSWTSATGSVGSPGTSSFGIHDAAFVRTTGAGGGDGGGDGGGTPPIDPNWSNIVINEVTADNNDNPELTDHLPPALLTALNTAPNAAGDLVELYNKGDQAVDITGWKQTDSHADSDATDFSGRVFDVNGNRITTIPAHAYGVFQSGQGLGSGGDAVKIFLPDGTPVDSVTYGAAQAGYDESVDPEGDGPGDTTEIYHALARCPDGAGAVNTTSDDATTSWYSVKAASFGSSNDDSCDTATDPTAAVQYYNELPPTGLPGTCTPSAPSGSDRIAVPNAVAWPTSDGVSNVDNVCEFVTPQDPIGNDMSSLVFSQDGSVLWGAQNKNHLWKLVKDPATGKYLPATDNDWGSGKGITFTGTDPNVSQPDDEGLTVGGNGNLFATSERDNQNSNVSKDEVLEYNPDDAGTTLAPVQQWDLTSEFVPSVIAATGDDANLGFEGITYVPDSFLTAHGFHDQNLNKTYDPADYPLHGAGLFFLGVEKNGHAYAYALNSDGSFKRVASIDTGIDGTSAIADLQFNADDQGLWTLCDNDCGVVESLLKIDSNGNFTRAISYNRPTGLPDDNLEGFAVAPASTAVHGKREVIWSDDGIYGEGNAWNADKTGNVPSAGWGHALYSGTIPVGLGTSPSSPGGGSVVLSANSSTVKAGDPITVTASGVTPGTEYIMTLHSTPVELGSGTAGADGALTITGTIPTDAATGAHTITIATASDPSTVLASMPLTVTAAVGGSADASGDLASTGSDLLPWMLGSVFLVLLGAGALTTRRLRRHRDA